MNLVIDTNIVFSTLLNPRSHIGDILMNIQDDFVFFAPDLLLAELKRYTSKIVAYSRLGIKDLADVEASILSTIKFISEEAISQQSWVQAFALTKDIDEDDTPFVALAIELDAKLWTGDKILASGLANRGADLIMTTAALRSLIG